MSDLDRGIMKFKGADTPAAIVISSTLVLGGIVILVIWALRHAYAA
jgi:type III secretory pathway component EscV